MYKNQKRHSSAAFGVAFQKSTPLKRDPFSRAPERWQPSAHTPLPPVYMVYIHTYIQTRVWKPSCTASTALVVRDDDISTGRGWARFIPFAKDSLHRRISGLCAHIWCNIGIVLCKQIDKTHFTKYKFQNDKSTKPAEINDYDVTIRKYL